jgi:hypothetical protein
LHHEPEEEHRSDEEQETTPGYLAEAVLRGGGPQRQAGDHQTQQNHHYAEDGREIARSHAGRGADIQRSAVDKEARANGHDNQAAEDIGSLSVCTLWDIPPVRCVGNDNADKHPAWPRMHNKFLVFCSLRENAWRGPELHPECVWTGSYNITFNAQKSFENAVILRDSDIAAAYAREWAQILALSEPLDWEDRWSAPEYRIGT